MYRHILVATDGSRVSLLAVAHASALSRALSSELLVLHVVDMGLLPLGPEVAIDTHHLAAARRTEGEALLAAGLEEARAAEARAFGRLVETDAPGQRVDGRIVQEAAAWPADLIVLGTHGRRGPERLILGSVAEGVARRSEVPVLLVRG
jgi:nucleotide-binding universal stress UspA family protein